MSKETTIKEIDGGIEYNGRIYTLDQNELNHKILKEIADRLIKLEKESEYLFSNEFSNILFNSGSSFMNDTVLSVGNNPGTISFTINGRTAVTDYRTALMVEQDKAVLVKIISKDKVSDNYIDKKSLTKEEKKQFETLGYITVLQ